MFFYVSYFFIKNAFFNVFYSWGQRFFTSMWPDAVILQSNNCVRRICSRSLHSDCLRRYPEFSPPEITPPGNVLLRLCVVFKVYKISKNFSDPGLCILSSAANGVVLQWFCSTVALKSSYVRVIKAIHDIRVLMKTVTAYSK